MVLIDRYLSTWKAWYCSPADVLDSVWQTVPQFKVLE